MKCKKCGKEIYDDLICPYCENDIIKNNENKKINYSISDCIKRFFKFYNKTSGRATLKEFLTIFTIIIIYNALFTILKLYIVNTVLNLILFIPTISLIIRRLHDANKSGAYSILYFNSIIFYAICQITSNDTMNVKLTMLFICLVSLSILLILLFKKSIPNSKWDDDNGY